MPESVRASSFLSLESTNGAIAHKMDELSWPNRSIILVLSSLNLEEAISLEVRFSLRFLLIILIGQICSPFKTKSRPKSKNCLTYVFPFLFASFLARYGENPLHDLW